MRQFVSLPFSLSISPASPGAAGNRRFKVGGLLGSVAIRDAARRGAGVRVKAPLLKLITN